FFAAIGSDVLGIQDLALVIDDESGFVRRSRRPTDLWLFCYRINDSRIHHIEFDKRAPETYATGEAVSGVIGYSHIGGEFLTGDHLRRHGDGCGFVLSSLNKIRDRIWQIVVERAHVIALTNAQDIV